SLETDDGEDENRPLGESVKDAVSGLFSAADKGRLPDSAPAKAAKDPDSGLHLDIGEPSRIVKLDAILAAGAAKRGGGQQTGSVFKLPGLDDDVASEAQKVANATGPIKIAPPAPGAGYSPVLAPLPRAHHDHQLWKVLAIGGGLASLVLIVVVVMLL